MVLIKIICEIIVSIVGIAIAIFIFGVLVDIYENYKIKYWKQASIKGYDRAIKDILEYGWYYNTNNDKVFVHVENSSSYNEEL